MGFFTKRPVVQETHECKLCGNQVSDELFIKDLGICHTCGITAKNYIENEFLTLLETFETKAKEATDPDTKVHYWGAVLGVLYEYKIKYQDNDVYLIEGNIEDQIDTVIDNISHAREL